VVEVVGVTKESEVSVEQIPTDETPAQQKGGNTSCLY
jgi:hypothetical protein